MEKEEHRKQVLRSLKEALKEDRAKTDVLGISKIGVVEMTRERVLKAVESISYEECPYCKGKGRTKSAATMAILVIKELKNLLTKSKFLELNVLLNSKVAEYILENNRSSLESLEKRFHVRIVVTSNPNLHIEEMKIL